MESAWDPVPTDMLLRKVEERYASQVLGSHHVVGEEDHRGSRQIFRACGLQGRDNVAKVVLSMVEDGAATDRHTLEASNMAQESVREEGAPSIPHVGVILGEIGQNSRVTN